MTVFEVYVSLCVAVCELAHLMTCKWQGGRAGWLCCLPCMSLIMVYVCFLVALCACVQHHNTAHGTGSESITATLGYIVIMLHAPGSMYSALVLVVAAACSSTAGNISQQQLPRATAGGRTLFVGVERRLLYHKIASC
jgi:hypothetical protein